MYNIEIEFIGGRQSFSLIGLSEEEVHVFKQCIESKSVYTRKRERDEHCIMCQNITYVRIFSPDDKGGPRSVN